MTPRSPGPTEIRQLGERIHQGKLSFGEALDNLMRRELPTDDVNATEDRVSRRLAAWVTVADKRERAMTHTDGQQEHTKKPTITQEMRDAVWQNSTIQQQDQAVANSAHEARRQSEQEHDSGLER